MADETTGTTESTTSTESMGTETHGTDTSTASQDTYTASTQGTTSAADTTTQVPEFSDPNMQKAWTEKTQKLAEERRTWESQRDTWEKGRADYERKAALFDKFDSDPEIVSFIRKRFGITDKPAISQDELIEAQSDPAKMHELIQKEAKKLIEPVAARMGNLELENSIQSYADTKGNEDFWDLYDAGLIKDKMIALRNGDPKVKDLDLIKKAHVEARQIVNSINERAERLARDKAAGVVEQKKGAMMDRGGRSTTAGTTTKSFKGKSITEVANEIMASK